MTPPPRVRLLIACPDAKGVVAAVSTALADHDANILEADQHTDPDTGDFFMRVELEPPNNATTESLQTALAPATQRFDLTTRIEPTRTQRLALLCSKQTHCAADILWRATNHELDAQIAFVASNHPDIQPTAEQLAVPFHRIDTADKPAAEAHILGLCEDADADVVVLARYMQILSEHCCAALPAPAINIHHSFLPAFAGARPYHQAFERGVKLIGATAHYVTPDLDQGPIIAQQTTSVSHRDRVQDLTRKGKDLERLVLAEALRLHLEHRVLTHHNRTVVFA